MISFEYEHFLEDINPYFIMCIIENDLAAGEAMKGVIVKTASVTTTTITDKIK